MTIIILMHSSMNHVQFGNNSDYAGFQTVPVPTQ